MKLRSFLVAVAAALILTGGIVPRANALLVTYFNFEDSSLNAAPPDFTSDQPPGAQASTLTVVFGGTPVHSVAGIALNVAAGDLDPNRLGMGFNNTEEHNATITFGVNTLGLTNLSLSFATNGNEGFRLATGSYSLDGGVTFLTAGVSAAVVLNDNGLNQLVTFTYPIAVNNLASVLFRVTLSDGQSDSNTLQTTVDNIQLNAIPEPATVVGGLLGACGLCWHQRRRLIRFLRLRPA